MPQLGTIRIRQGVREFQTGPLPLIPIPRQCGFRLEGHCLQPGFRRFVQTAPEGTQWISLIHPSRAIMTLRALVAPVDCKIPAVIGFDFLASETSDNHPDFVLSGPGGNLRDDSRGRNVAFQMSAVYPPLTGMPVYRSADYPQRDTQSTPEDAG
jgi:hypothetical protein